MYHPASSQTVGDHTFTLCFICHRYLRSRMVQLWFLAVTSMAQVQCFAWIPVANTNRRCAHHWMTSSSDVPLIFLPGLKGCHLANGPNKRSWLTLEGLLNVPPRADHFVDRDLALPLTYTQQRQHSGALVPDGIVKHIVDVGPIRLLPFYGHITTLLDETDRPTACYTYDWRRNPQELVDDFFAFCCQTFPHQPVQLVGHSFGGLIAYAAMRDHPEKFKPGLVLVGVPFGTGIQYLQDLHRGYYTELNRCRQFLPETQFTMSSHWIFFPTSNVEQEVSLVDVTNRTEVTFNANTSSIGKSIRDFRPATNGTNVEINFYSVRDWEQHRLGVFGMDHIHYEKIELYRKHMNIQLNAAKEFRQRYLSIDQASLPPLIVCASDSEPTINQILRRTLNDGSMEYDYVSGRSVPGDGRIYFDAAFPPSTTHHSVVRLKSMHAKQLLWEAKGGDLGTIWKQVVAQVDCYVSVENADSTKVLTMPGISVTTQ